MEAKVYKKKIGNIYLRCRKYLDELFLMTLISLLTFVIESLTSSLAAIKFCDK